MVRLITHNILACHAKSCTSSPANFPLDLKDVEIVLREAEFNEGFLKGFMPKIEWQALVDAAKQVSGAFLCMFSPSACTTRSSVVFLYSTIHHCSFFLMSLITVLLARRHIAPSSTTRYDGRRLPQSATSCPPRGTYVAHAP